MQSISNRRFAEPGGGRLRAIVGMSLFLAFAGIFGSELFAQEKSTTHVVVIENMKFSPNALRVRIGDRIEFKNRDLVPHTATARSAGAFDSGVVKPGESWVFAPKEAGTFDYTCTFHPMMKGRFTVDGK